MKLSAKIYFLNNVRDEISQSFLFWEEFSTQLLVKVFSKKKSKTKHNRFIELRKIEKYNTLSNLFIKMLLKRGLKKKYSLVLFQATQITQSKFNLLDPTLITQFPNYTTYFNIGRDDKTIFSFDFLIQSCLIELTTIFTIQACRIPTKIKKRQKIIKKYTLVTKYLEHWKRIKWLTKQIILLCHHQNYYSLYSRLYFSLIHLFLLPKVNRIYESKLEAYSIMLNKYKSKSY